MKKKKDPTISLPKEELQKQLKRKSSALERLKRKLKIEASFECVRARAMAMQKSDELQEVANTIYERLKELEVETDFANLISLIEDSKDYYVWVSDLSKPVRIPFNDFTEVQRIYNDVMERRDELFTHTYSGKIRNEYYQFLLEQTDLGKNLPEVQKKKLLESEFNTASLAFTKNTGIQLVRLSAKAFSKEENEILKRLVKVFEQAYTRFLDLQKAEAQARESLFQLALERVRARTMAMKRSDELANVATILFQQVKALGVPQWTCGFNIWEPGDKDFTFYPGSPDGDILSPFKVPLTEHPVFIQFDESRKRGDELYVYEKTGEVQADHYRYMLSVPGGLGDMMQGLLDAGLTFPTFQIDHLANFSHGNLVFITYEPVPEMWDIFKRFAKVFEQTYTRFLDLQKAEAQAREAKIEAALERVRSRTMAMQRSEELPNAALLMFQQLQALGVPQFACSFNIWDDDRKASTCWGATEDALAPPFKTSSSEDIFVHILEAAQRGESLFVIEQDGEELEAHYRYLTSIPEVKAIVEEMSKAGLSWPPFQIIHCAFFSHGYLMFITYEPVPESHDIFKRFGKVFEQTYTRFLDIQKAEAQAREAQIEAALERVRSRSMGMQKSEELKEVIQVVYEQFVHLNIHIEHTGFIMDYKARDDMYIWLADQHGAPSQVTIPYFDSEPWNSFNEAKEKGMDFFANNLTFEEKNRFYQKLFKYIPGLPEEAKEYYFSCRGLAISTVLLENVCLYIENFSGIPYSDEENNTLMRFGKVFQQTYTRFLDLQKVEAQAREALIETALERVRSRTMAMQHSEELAYVASIVFKQLYDLGIKTYSSGFNIWEEDDDSIAVCWMSKPDGAQNEPFSIPYTEDPFFKEIYEARQSGKDFLVMESGGAALAETYRYMFNLPGIREIFIGHETTGFPTPTFQITHCVFFPHGYLMFITLEAYPEAWDIFKRFGKVFEQTYTRFLDLQKAEAQAREAQIQLALERVRARTMAMQRSEELADAATVLFQQVKSLGISQWTCGFNIWEPGDKEFTFYPGSPDGDILPPCKNVPLTEDPVFILFDESRKRGDELCVYESKDEIQEAHYRYMLALPGGLGAFLQTLLDHGVQFPTFQIDHIANFSHGNLLFITYEHFPEMHDIFKRFAKVFEQTYTRFLDLQKAEAQARESQIQLAMERVRARTMAMQNSNELPEAANLLFQQVQSLGMPAWSAGYCIWQEDKNTITAWMSSEGVIQPPFRVPLTEEATFIHMREGWEKGESFYVDEIGGEVCKKHYEYMRTLPSVGKILDSIIEAGHPLPTFQIMHMAYFSQGFLLFITYEPVPQSHDIFKRFAKVFEQTYTRFLDLQKAEAQARESQIEAALERVRSRSMGMQKSEELRDVIQVIFEQFILLNISLDGAGFAMDYRESDDFNFWLADSSSAFANKVHIPYFDHPQFNVFKEAKEKGVDFFANSLTFEEKNRFFDHILKSSSHPIPSELQEVGYNAPGYITSHVFLKNVALYILNFSGVPFSDAENATLMRFGKVFEQTYTRFNDLKKAEAQALEAIKRASVDRVRAEIASMRTTNDLEKITPLVWNELTTLGVPFIRCGVFIMDEEQQQVRTMLSTPDGKAIATLHVPFEFDLSIITNGVTNWRKKKMYKEHWDAPAFTKAWVKLSSLRETSMDSPQTEHPPENLYLHMLPFLQGMLYVGNDAPLNEDELQLVQNLADAFSTAYARYEDFNKLESANIKIEKTLVDLKQTQAQLVQSEKMASLGELTAGIAHEIQNPLNFVNNFSELNKELLGELNEEIEKGNYEEVKIIAQDVTGNEEKISHHGKRADAIVKGMLQHSRSSSATKEPTDINKLADEYLRLAYHGLRAKDKEFNATMKTDFDETIGNINIIPQDIGRVLLNLYNNAFYAVAERKKQQPDGYEPIVSISTNHSLSLGEGWGEVRISVKDNGNGIPQKVVDKIFQPFFTTKPTGQGTGLGLSLAYDIIKAHGGEIDVKTEEAKGSEFIIQLPTS